MHLGRTAKFQPCPGHGALERPLSKQSLASRRGRKVAQSPAQKLITRPAEREWPLDRSLASQAATLEPTTKPSHDDHTSQEPRHHDVKEQFQWRDHWYPVGVIEFLHKDKPTAVSLLNEDLVLWCDGDDQWNAAVDECPHKLAPLSEGRLENGVLECRYHAWQFGSNGSCLYNPQSGDKAGQGGLKSPKTCLKMLPTQVKQGLLWVWPEGGEAARLASQQKQPHTYDQAEEEAWMGSSNPFDFLETDVSWGLMVENSLDPSHAPSLHEDALGPRTEMAPMAMSTKLLHVTDGVLLAHGGYKNSQIQGKLEAERHFIPPHTVKTAYKMGNGFRVDAILYFVPSKPGHCLTFVKFLSKLPESMQNVRPGFGRMAKKLPRILPKGPSKLMLALRNLVLTKQAARHSSSHGLQDQDHLMLHHSERRMALGADLKRRPLDWKRYHLASQADVGVASFWKWIEDHSGGDIAWAHGATSADLDPKKGRATLFDHYSRHTRHCTACQEAVARIDYLRKAALIAATALAAVILVLSPGPAVRIAGAALAGTVLALRQWLATIRQPFFTADKLPDE